MRQTLEIKLGQRLALTPQLQQAIRILQLSTQELQTEIQEALETNPLLEEAESFEATETAAEEPGRPAQDMQPVDAATKADAPSTQEYELNDGEWTDTTDPAWSQRRNTDDFSDNLLENRNSGDISLHDHLRWQLGLGELSPENTVIAEYIIDAIGDDGYLTSDLEDIRVMSGQILEVEVSTEQVEQTLRQIQQFEPAGVGARSLKECLILQLQQTDIPPADRALAVRIVENHLGHLANHDLQLLSHELDATLPAVERAAQIIQELHPRPGNAIGDTHADYIAPDVVVDKKEGQWVVELNRQLIPRLRIQQYYAEMLASGPKRANGDNAYLKEHLQQAQWLLKSIDSRNSTIFRVAQVIVDSQKEFFEHGPTAMKPMVLQDIAEKLGLHESTISRATANKYMLTPGGVFELRYFFSSHVQNTDGDACSATVVRAMIKSIIENEPANKPISDSQLTKMLEDKGIQVARRTVAKYREGLNIPSSTKRKIII